MRLVLIVVWLLASLMAAVGRAQPTAERLLDEMRQARSKIENYTAMCRVRGPMGNIWSNSPTSNESDTDVYLEWSRTDEHYVMAYREHGDDEASWKIRGISNSLWLWSANTTNPKHVLANHVLADERTLLGAFDPLAIGLGFRHEFDAGKKFDAVLKGLQDTVKIPQLMSSVKQAGPLVTWNYNFDTEIVFDAEHGYWPVSLTYPNTSQPKISWKVDLQKRFGLDVPVHATLVSHDQNKREQRTVVDIDWISINLPIKFGTESVQRLSEKFHMQMQFGEDVDK